MTLVATTIFPSLWHALLVPAAFLTLSILVGAFVSPLIVGRRLTLNPVVIFIEPLAPLGEFLGQ